VKNEPSSSRATAALVVTVVLLIGGFVVVLVLLLRPPAVGAIDATLSTALVAAIGGIFAMMSLALRYWFPNPRRHYPDDDDGEN
jgi:hypothetical protein